MRMKLTYPSKLTIPAIQFADKVLEWFELLNVLPNSAWGIDEMQWLCIKLMDLQRLALQLPRFDDMEDYEDEKSIKRKKKLNRSICFDSRYKYYYTVFFPYAGVRDRNDLSDEPVMGNLEDDIYDICDDLQEGLNFYENRMIYRAVYVWRLHFFSHWGEHASQALYAMDHAIREYINDDDMGKHDNPDEDLFYPPVAYDDIDHCFIAHVSQKDTYLPYEILIDSLGSDEDDIPMVGVAVDDKVVFISVSEEPEILSRYRFPDEDKILDWIKRHRDPIARHWDHELDDLEVLNAVSEP